MRRLTDIERLVRACLPPDLADRCQVAGLRDGCLRLITDSPAWAARLRFQEPHLIQTWKQQRSSDVIRKIQVRVTPREQAPAAPVRKLVLTADNGQLLEQAARGIADPHLAQALRRLARHGAGPRR